MANDIRRQAVLDLTNALCSANRVQRALTQTPRHTQEGSAAQGAEQEAARQLQTCTNRLREAREALEELDTF